VLQHIGTGGDGQPQLELSVAAEDAPRQSLARMQLPWTAAQ
ncbi:type II secretion system protein GspI, partial [Corallococcus coralloides]|nr:type II secretion system protein GspI [Corallococcus coralloides]